MPVQWRAGFLAGVAAALLAGCQSTNSLLEAPQVDYKSAGQSYNFV